MGTAYPELKRSQDFASNVLEQEELRFRTTLGRGLKMLDGETKDLPPNSTLSGEVAFKLYDTYGFSVDLTEDILKSKKISVDLDGFNKNMQEQQERARKSWAGSHEEKTEQIWFDIRLKFGCSEFLGYSINKVDGKILALIKDNKSVNYINNINEKFILISNQTPFYGESGGQLGDIGTITSPHSKIRVINTLKYLGSIISHICILEEGAGIKVGETANFAIDTHYRKNLRIHHSATHILHAALQEILGHHVTQKGSLVAYDRLRFDISHNSALTKEQIILIENKVNQIITNDFEVVTKLMPMEEALKSGAMALFGEKYEQEVRVVSIGDNKGGNIPYSLELCGGTHVNRTGEIGMFKVISENSIALGVRRIEAVCGEFVLALLRNQESLLENLSSDLKVTKNEIRDKVTNLVRSKKELEEQIMNIKISMLDLSAEQIAKESINLQNIRLIYKIVEGDYNSKLLRIAAEQITKKVEDIVLILINQYNTLLVTVAVSKEISNKINAGVVVKEISIFLGGKGGGGQATIAQAGAIDVSKLNQLPEMLNDLLIRFLNN